MSPEVDEPVALRAGRDREDEAWSRRGSNQASSGHVEVSDSDMYDIDDALLTTARGGGD